MATQLDFPELSKKMKGLNTTEGYDILISYTEEKINQLLRERSEKLKSILEFGPIPGSFKFGGTELAFDLYMSLGHPLLQFDDELGNITLTFEIQKGYYEAKPGGTKTNLTPGLELSFKTILVNATGTVDSSQSKDGFAGSVKPAMANEPVILNPDEKNVSQGVCISFAKASVDLLGTDDASRKAVEENAFILGSLKKYFQQNAELKYFIAGVSNQYHPDSGSQFLQPRSFCFNTLKGKTKEDESVLCMWISVKEGTNRDDSSNQEDRGTFYDKGSIPIPKGRSCSMIMNNDLLVKQFLLPSLSKVFKNTTLLKFGESEISFGGNMIVEEVDVPAIPLGGGSIKVAGIKFSPSSPKASISFSSEINSQAHSIRYTSDEQHVDWEHWTTKTSIGGEKRIEKEYGTTNLTFEWAATGSWKDKKTTDHPNLLGFEWKRDGYWTILTSAEDQSIWQRFLGGSTRIPPNLQNLKVSGPEVSLEMSPLDYFLTTNLLYPGEHMFKADDPSSSSTDKGIALPHDLILTGEIKIN